MGISKCPKCTTRIEKSKGCNFITCPSSVCKNKAHYCYKCLVPLNIKVEIHILFDRMNVNTMRIMIHIEEPAEFLLIINGLINLRL